MRDWRPGITRECVTGGAGTRTYPKRLFVLSRWPTCDRASSFLFGEVSCRIHYIERNVVVIWRRNVARSLHFAPPPPKCEPTICECQSITVRWLRPWSWACRPTAVSHFDSSDLTDGVFADAAYRWAEGPQGSRPPTAPPPARGPGVSSPSLDHLFQFSLRSRWIAKLSGLRTLIQTEHGPER